MLWTDGREMSMGLATMGVWFPDPTRPVLASDRATRWDVDAKRCCLLLDRGRQTLGEDGGAVPVIQTTPVSLATGGRHPSLLELGSVSLTNVGHDDDWGRVMQYWRTGGAR